MNLELEYPGWQEPLAAAILEFNPQQLCGKLQKAEEAITNRIQELAGGEDNEHELRLLFDGLSILRDVKKGRLDLRDREPTQLNYRTRGS